MSERRKYRWNNRKQGGGRFCEVGDKTSPDLVNSTLKGRGRQRSGRQRRARQGGEFSRRIVVEHLGLSEAIETHREQIRQDYERLIAEDGELSASFRISIAAIINLAEPGRIIDTLLYAGEELDRLRSSQRTRSVQRVQASDAAGVVAASVLTHLKERGIIGTVRERKRS